MNMKKLDKKQVPQFAALCVLSAGLFGYLVVHLVSPGPVAAGTRGPASPAAPSAGQAAAGPAAQAAAGPAAPAGSSAMPDPASADAPPPSPTMHDPFAVGYADPATVLPAVGLGVLPALPKLPAAGKLTASLGPLPVGPLPAGPSAPALPGSLSGFSAPAAPGLPSAPAAPALPSAPLWTVTGVLQGAAGKVAILRSGEARRIVRSGDFVDSTYRVTGVSRTSVTLRHGAAVYHLVLGAEKAAPGTPSAAPAAPSGPSVSLPAISAPAISAPSDAAPAPQSAALDNSIIPVYHMPRTHAPLAHLRRQGPDLALAAGAPSLPKTGRPVSPAKVASAISLGLRLLDGSVLAQNQSRKE